MKERNNPSQIIKHIDYRFDQMEKLITLSLMNDVLSLYADRLCESLSDEIKQAITEHDFKITKTELFSDKVAVYLSAERKVGIRELRELKKVFSSHDGNMILVFEMEKATSAQKRKFVEEKISYYIKEKELFISKDEGTI